VLTSDDRVVLDEIINEIVDGYEKYDVQHRKEGGVSTYMLIIRRLVMDDGGTYTCQINIKSAPDKPYFDAILVVLS